MINLILIDMDGVIADFVSLALEIHGRPELLDQWPAGHWDIASLLGIPDEQLWETIDHHERLAGFWSALDPYPWMNELIDVVESTGIEWAICSKPSNHGSSSSGKVEWLQEHFGKDFRNYHLTPRKHDLAKPTTLLIDDSDANCDQFITAGGEAILFPQQWNKNHSWDLDKESYVRWGLEQVLS